MSEYVPTTEEVRDDYQWGVHACGCCAERLPEDVEAFDRWLAAHDAVVAAKAWSEGWSARASRGYAHLKVGECVPPPAYINPYRKAVQ